MKHYCGRSVQVGHGSSATCGEFFYTSAYQCDHCKLEDSNDLNEELLQALKQMLDVFYHDPLGGGQDAAIEAALDAVAKVQGEK